MILPATWESGRSLVFHRDPNTIFVLTTNHDYAGCRGLNESVVSRMEMVIYKDLPDISETVDRVMAKTGFSSRQEAVQMAEAVFELALHCKEQLITGGVCGGRELEAWIRTYMVMGDLLEAAKCTVITKASMDLETQVELLDVLSGILGKKEGSA